MSYSEEILHYKKTDYTHLVPHLTTARSGPLEKLESHFITNQADIEEWFRQQWHETPAPFYASVDLRNSGFKLAPVDTNLFPAGFNNLNPAFLPLCVQAAQSAIQKIDVNANRLLIISENHTRNLYYLESVSTLRDILQKAGYEVRIGSLLPNLTTNHRITLPSEKHLTLEPISREANMIYVNDFIPSLILLNNDFTSGHPSILDNIRQEIIPPLKLGWHNRLKSDHFTCYYTIAQAFSQKINSDPWLITPLFKNCGEIDFLKKAGAECLASHVATLLGKIQKKYTEYKVPNKPFVMIKADAGSYGMGVMTIHDANDIFELNRKQRKRMSATKEGKKINKVIIQEGVYTFETWGEKALVAEPVVYMIDHFVVGGFYRVHTTRGDNENLNAVGMYFEPLAFADSCTTLEQHSVPDAQPNRFYAYGVVARLALLAAAWEKLGMTKL